MIQSTINDYVYYHLDEDDAESGSNNDPKVATHTSDGKKRKVTDTGTTNGNYPHKLLINRLIPEIIPVVIPPIDQTTVDGVAVSGGNLHARRTIVLEDIVTDAVRSAACVFKYPTVVDWKDTDGMIPWDRITVGTPPHIEYPSLDWCWNLCLPK